MPSQIIKYKFHSGEINRRLYDFLGGFFVLFLCVCVCFAVLNVCLCFPKPACKPTFLIKIQKTCSPADNVLSIPAAPVGEYSFMIACFSVFMFLFHAMSYP